MLIKFCVATLYHKFRYFAIFNIKNFVGDTTHRSHSRAVSLGTLASGAPCLAAKSFAKTILNRFRFAFRLEPGALCAPGSQRGGGSKRKTHPIGCVFLLEATPGFEPGNKGFADLCLTTWLWRLIKFCGHDVSLLRARSGADYGARTRHLDLGKVALYQMS